MTTHTWQPPVQPAPWGDDADLPPEYLDLFAPGTLDASGFFLPGDPLAGRAEENGKPLDP